MSLKHWTMTISYNLDVASASPLNFFRLIFRWKASIWKICLKELLVWTIAFLLITFVYRTPYFLNDYQKTYGFSLNLYYIYTFSISNITFNRNSLKKTFLIAEMNFRNDWKESLRTILVFFLVRFKYPILILNFPIFV